MSTVGFGDISAVTYFGRIFMMIQYLSPLDWYVHCKMWKNRN